MQLTPRVIEASDDDLTTRERQCEVLRRLMKEEFRARFRADPLSCYGKEKLLILANRYNVRGCQRMYLSTLRDKLRPLVTPADFPIRDGGLRAMPPPGIVLGSR
jgi:hypothetical protein